MENNVTIENILHLLSECMRNAKIRKYTSLSMYNRIYMKLHNNPECFYRNIEIFEELFQRIKQHLEKLNETTDRKNERYIIEQIFISLRKLDSLCSHSIYYNSENYYDQQIKELKAKENKLNDELEKLRTKKEQSQNDEQIEQYKQELKLNKEQIKQYEQELEELKKKLDARENIKKQINIAFDELKKHTSHLIDEKTRLNWMFGIYAFLCFAVLTILIYFEYSYLSKWETAYSWIDYLPFYIPLPIVGGLLWIFISQMNRAQRQLIQVANTLYHIDYIEGLLLAINHISADANSASDKICNALDDLIKSHMLVPDGLSEQYLDTEISKDNINLSTFINLAKEVKEVIK